MPRLDQIVLASGNPGKIREIADLFAPIDIKVLAQSELGIESPEETGTTFVENAMLKASFAAQHSGLPSVADDSGIAIDALQGRPGVWSARYAGCDASDKENLQKLMQEMIDVPDGSRCGGFHCAAVLVFPENERPPVVVEAVWRGEILREPAGVDGFGYDPIFFDPDIGKTGAQMSRKEKNRASHRGQAFRELRDIIQAFD